MGEPKPAGDPNSAVHRAPLPFAVRSLLGRVEIISREHFCAGTPKNEGPNHEIQF